ncbi:MAG TPA: hypothetical protein VH307_11660 [Streptosporangiaceae bacterium]|nr:hypothetical protein [Streptosporangiaceae bacterium]
MAVVVQVMTGSAAALVWGVNVSLGAGTSTFPVPGSVNARAWAGLVSELFAVAAGRPVSVPETGFWPLSGTEADACLCFAVTVAVRSKDTTPLNWLSTDEGSATLVVFSVMGTGTVVSARPGTVTVALTVTGGIPLPYADRAQEYWAVKVVGMVTMVA